MKQMYLLPKWWATQTCQAMHMKCSTKFPSGSTKLAENPNPQVIKTSATAAIESPNSLRTEWRWIKQRKLHQQQEASQEATINNELNINFGSEKAEQDRKAEDDEPNNVNQQQSLRGRTATPHLAKP